MIGTLLGGAGAMGLNFLSSAMQYAVNKDLLHDAQQHQIRMMKNAHQWEVSDLRKAGLNPILSANSSPTAYSAQSASVQAPDFDIASKLATLQGFSSANDMQRFARENHEVDLAIKEADLAGRELSQELIRSEIHQRNAQTAMTLLDHERRSRPWYRNFEDMRDLRSAFGKQSVFGKTMDDIFVNPWLEALHSADKVLTNKKGAIQIRKRPSTSNFTNYQYRYYRKK